MINFKVITLFNRVTESCLEPILYLSDLEIRTPYTYSRASYSSIYPSVEIQFSLCKSPVIVGLVGLEPTQIASKAIVLPLHHSPMF